MKIYKNISFILVFCKFFYNGRFSELEEERKELNETIESEQLKSPIYTKEHFEMALHNIQKIDITEQDGKRKIIDTFINSIFIYDDNIKIIYNANGKEEVIKLEELESSTLFTQGEPRRGKLRLNAI